MTIPGEEYIMAPTLLSCRMDRIGMDVAQVARKSGLSKATVYRAITPGVSVSYPSTMKILAALGGSAPFIFDGDD